MVTRIASTRDSAKAAQNDRNISRKRLFIILPVYLSGLAAGPRSASCELRATGNPRARGSKLGSLFLSFRCRPRKHVPHSSNRFDVVSVFFGVPPLPPPPARVPFNASVHDNRQ